MVLLLARHLMLDGPLEPQRGWSYAVVVGAAGAAVVFAFVFAQVTERHTGRVRRLFGPARAPEPRVRMQHQTQSK